MAKAAEKTVQGCSTQSESPERKQIFTPIRGTLAMEFIQPSNGEEIQSLGIRVPVHFRKNAKPTWHQRRRKHAVLQLMAGVSGQVLDYGCGYGDLTYALSRSNSAIGCDVDADRVAFAAREYAPIPFVRCDASGTPFSDGSFDAIVSVVVIHFVPDPAHYLAEVARLLKPGGTFAIICQNQPVLRNALRRILGKGDAPNHPPPMQPAAKSLWVPTKQDMARLLTQAGFEIVDSTFFYDPPLQGWKNFGDYALGVIEQFCSLLHLPDLANYYGYRTCKMDHPPGQSVPH